MDIGLIIGYTKRAFRIAEVLSGTSIGMEEVARPGLDRNQ
jgi:hypothetical protein